MPNYYPDPNYLDANSPIQSFFDNLIQILTADLICLASSNIQSLSIKSFKSALKEKHNQIFSKTQKKVQFEYDNGPECDIRKKFKRTNI